MNPNEQLEIDDFNGDEALFNSAKIELGMRVLSQEEKILMFAIADGRMKEGYK